MLSISAAHWLLHDRRNINKPPPSIDQQSAMNKTRSVINIQRCTVNHQHTVSVTVPNTPLDTATSYYMTYLVLDTSWENVSNARMIPNTL